MIIILAKIVAKILSPLKIVILRSHASVSKAMPTSQSDGIFAGVIQQPHLSTFLRIKPLQDKIQLFLTLGSQVGILIDPEQLTLTIYRPNGQQIVLKNTDRLNIPELLPGWEIPVAEIWSPVFE